MSALPSTPDSAAPAGGAPWVVCLCAEWCGTCRDYRPLFEQVARAHPGLRFAWVDIEDHADIADEFDVETFPTLLVADSAGTRFLGPLLPHAETLSRMLTALPAPQPSSLHAELMVAVLEKKPALFAVPRAA
ncbi:thioredoxin family protein [Variovorax paradoxus]|uniref:thioredoxin family protein n=1 Tax=Variovorax paradoxus TaxID=34073 RepID=UPI0019325F2C|nr:thioredoxin family protein [Variovorax paradoxus]